MSWAIKIYKYYQFTNDGLDDTGNWQQNIRRFEEIGVGQQTMEALSDLSKDRKLKKKEEIMGMRWNEIIINVVRNEIYRACKS